MQTIIRSEQPIPTTSIIDIRTNGELERTVFQTEVKIISADIDIADTVCPDIIECVSRPLPPRKPPTQKIFDQLFPTHAAMREVGLL